MYLEPKLVAILDQLVGSGNEFQIIDMAEVGGDLRTENPSGSTSIDGPILDVLWI